MPNSAPFTLHDVLNLFVPSSKQPPEQVAPVLLATFIIAARRSLILIALVSYPFSQEHDFIDAESEWLVCFLLALFHHFSKHADISINLPFEPCTNSIVAMCEPSFLHGGQRLFFRSASFIPARTIIASTRFSKDSNMDYI